jgi:hypothetical protein
VEPSLNAAIAAARARSPDVRAIGVADSIPEGARAISPEEARMAPGPIALVFGGPAEVWLPPIRTVSLLNDLPLAAAFAAVLERLLGEG